MPYRYPMAIPEGFLVPSEHVHTWDGYKRARCEGVADPMLCDVLNSVKPPAELSPVHAWPTLVLGSECLRLRNPGARRVLELLPGELKDEFAKEIASLSPSSTVAEQRRWATSTLQFVEQLIFDRLGLSSQDGREGLPVEGRQSTARVGGEPVDAEVPELNVMATLRGYAGRGGRAEPGRTDGPAAEAAAARERLVDLDEVQARNDAADQSSSYADWELELMIAAASLTQHYFTGKLESSRSVSRLAVDSLTLEGRFEPYHTQSQKALSALKASLGRHELDGVDGIPRLRDVTKETLHALGDGRIALASVQALTEFAWNQVIRAFSLYSWYPEWQEFLVRLSMDQRSKPIGDGYLRPVAQSTTNAASMVKKALEPTTVQSAAWYEIGHPVDESARVDAYAGYAQLLHRLADYRRARLERASSAATMLTGLGQQDPGATGAAVPPPASAFVTSFDVELELAMAAHYPDRAFAVAIPVNLVENLEGTNLGTTMWLGYVVRPDPGRSLLDRVTKPDPDAWFIFERPADNRSSLDAALVGDAADTQLLVGALVGAGVKRLGELPIIIRLAGSPMVQLPEIQDAEGGINSLGRVAFERAQLEGYLDKGEDNRIIWEPLARDRRPVRSAFVPATLLDEHNAIRLSLPEVVAQRPDRSLPPELTAAMQGRYWRYWILLGVEMSDPVIRYRVIAQVLGASLRVAPRSKYVRPQRRGVVLNNKRHNARALELLAWSGFDVVIDREAPGPMTRELRHFLDHLHEKNKGRWPRDEVECTAAPIVDEETQ